MSSKNKEKASLVKHYLKPSKQTVINWIIGTIVVLGFLYWINGGTKVNGHSFVRNNGEVQEVKKLPSNFDSVKSVSAPKSDNPLTD